MTTKMSLPLEAGQAQTLQNIASQLLSLRSGTPKIQFRKTLGPHRRDLDQLESENLVRVVNDQYLPTYKGIDRLGGETAEIARETLGILFHVLQKLFKEHDDPSFNFGSIAQAVQLSFPTFGTDDIAPAIILGRDFGYYFVSGPEVTDGGLSIQGVHVVEQILDFTSVGEAWLKKLAEEDRQRSILHGANPSFDATIIEPVDVQFMHSDSLKKIVERDYAELQEVRTVNAIKSRYVLCGGLIEALLLDILLSIETQSKEAAKAPKNKAGQPRQITEWDLSSLIDVAVELGVIETDAERFSHGVRNYRNLIHPGREMRSAEKVAKEEADIAEKVLDIIVRELRGMQRS